MTSRVTLPNWASFSLILVSCAGSHGPSGFDPGSGMDGGSGGFDAGSMPPPLGPTDIDASAVCSPDPSYYDVPGDNCDNDADGQVDNVIVCDSDLSANGDAMAF